jgi:hypothetical protein
MHLLTMLVMALAIASISKEGKAKKWVDLLKKKLK